MDIQRYLDNYFSSKDMPFIAYDERVCLIPAIKLAMDNLKDPSASNYVLEN